ncbi:unannotated protein [freshwater metagenome]|uniref:Unannotated protein n=1 Tax=freshwater metagenome TaxID=449393 RepID=A0A6J7EGL1_9ZZZZ|nr:c-type cytochrome [Actinomycetota bacterium]
MVVFALIVFAFILATIAVVIVASVSRRQPSPTGPSRGAAKLLFTGIAVVVVVIGIGLPVVLLIDDSDTADRSTPVGVTLTADQAVGRQLFAQNCSNCHSLKASNSVATTGPNFDKMRPPEGLVENAILLGRARGNGNMPAGLLTGKNAKDVAAYVAAVAGHASPGLGR